jgi:DNA (cytosine-5)-methyltransferase 1
MEKLRHFDTFSGYGGFTISAQKLGWETVGFSEVDKYANAVLEYNFNIKNYGDITKIKGEDLPDVDIITGGSPCQDLSVAGKGAGLNGARSGLFFCFINLIKEKQPMYFVWENVKGALSSSRGWDFARVQIEMEQAGYDVWWQLINAKDFGVPQNRERIFAIGIRKGSGREVLFEQRESRQNPNKIVNTGHEGTNIFGTDGIATTQKALGGGQGAKTGLYAVPNKSRRGQVIVHNLQPRSPNRPSLLKNKNAGGSGHLQREDGITYTVDTGCTQGVEIVGNIYNSGGENGDVLDPRGISKTIKSGETSTKGNVHSLDANYWKGSNNPNKSRRSQIAVPVLTPDRENKRQNGRRFKTDGEPSFTITGQDRHGVFNGMRIRRLTPTECERLMGLQDGWTAKGIIDGKEVDISDTQRYKMCGNGVVVNCVDYIYKLLRQ